MFYMDIKKNVQMSFQKIMGIKKIESIFYFIFLGQCYYLQTSEQYADPDSDSDSESNRRYSSTVFRIVEESLYHCVGP